MAARASSAAMWCAPSPRPGRACGSRSGALSSPATFSRSAAWARSMPCRPMCALPIRCSPPPTAPMPSSISSASCFRPASRPSNRCRTRARAMSPRRRRAAGARALVHVSAIGASADAALGLCAQQGGRRGRGQIGLCGRRHSAAVHRVRAGGRFLQPLCRARAHRAGAAVDRRRQDAIGAGVRRRRGQGGDRRPHGQGRSPRGLRAGRARSAHV